MTDRALGPALLLVLLLGMASAACAAGFDAFDSAAIEPKLGAALPESLAFIDETGARVTLAGYLGQHPVILAPVDFDCRNICGVTLAGLFDALSRVTLDPGSFAVLAISIDPREAAADARAARISSLSRYRRADAAQAVHFLASDGAGSSRRLADALGYHYAYDAGTDQFAHPAAVALITPGGRLARWLHGYPFEASDLRLALTEAGEGTVGTLADHLWLLCYGYDPRTGTYTADVDLALKAGAGLTMLLLGALVALLWRRERRTGGPG